MEPKFQSSFIPKGPIAASGNPTPSQGKDRSLVGFLALTIFSLTVLLSVGVFGYNRFLSYRISQIGSELEAARSDLDSGSLRELIKLDSRINSTGELLANHVVISPLFKFLEENTLRNVRFVELNYATTDEGLVIRMFGQARSYAAVALQSETFNESQYFKNPVFSDLSLDEEGNVTFSFSATVDPSLISYRRVVEREALLQVPEVETLPEAQDGEEVEGTATTSEETSI